MDAEKVEEHQRILAERDSQLADQRKALERLQNMFIKSLGNNTNKVQRRAGGVTS